MSVEIRPANLADLPSILAVDESAEREERRYDYISRAIRGEHGRSVLVLFLDEEPVGFTVTGEFFGHPFLELIATSPSVRRRGVASALMVNLEAAIEGDRMFVSTNESNDIMRQLLVKRGYRLQCKLRRHFALRVSPHAICQHENA